MTLIKYIDEKGIPVLDETAELYYRKLNAFQFDDMDKEFYEMREHLSKCSEEFMKLLSPEQKKAFLRYEEADSALQSYLQYYNFKKGIEYQRGRE